MLWLLYAMGVVVTSVIFVLLSKKVLSEEENHDPIAYAATSFLTVGIYAGIFYLITSFSLQDFRNLFTFSLWRFLAIDFILYAIAPSIYYRVLKKLPASEVQILYTFVGFFALLIGIFIGTETFNLLRAIGGLCIFSGVYVVTQKKGKWKLGTYGFLLLFATFLYGAAAVTDNFIITRNFFSIPFFQMIQFCLPALILLAINPKSVKRIRPMLQHKKIVITIAMNSFFFFLNYLFIFKAYASGGTTSQVNMFFSTETIIMVVFAAIFLKERDHFSIKLLAGILATVGVLLLAL